MNDTRNYFPSAPHRKQVLERKSQTPNLFRLALPNSNP